MDVEPPLVGMCLAQSCEPDALFQCVENKWSGQETST